MEKRPFFRAATAGLGSKGLILPSLYLDFINMICTNHIVLLRAYHSSPLNQ